jgi:tRNA modification GTPase
VLVDVAGLEADAQQASSLSIIHCQMAEASRLAIETADFVVRVIDATDDRPPLTLPREHQLTVRTKTDLRRVTNDRSIAVSAAKASGLDELRAALDAMAFPQLPSEAGSTLALNARHLAEIAAARDALARARGVIQQGPEFTAFELRTALDHLGRILGTVSPDDVLGRIFSSFCIGK